MIGNVGLPGWFVATGLRVSLKQLNSRGIPGSFGAIFSDVNRLDVCPVGYYNRRMTFLRGTPSQMRDVRSSGNVPGSGTAVKVNQSSSSRKPQVTG